MLCPRGNDSHYFSSSVSMLRVKTKSEFVSPVYLYWQIIILVVNRHLEGHRTSHRMPLSLNSSATQWTMYIIYYNIVFICTASFQMIKSQHLQVHGVISLTGRTLCFLVLNSVRLLPAHFSIPSRCF